MGESIRDSNYFLQFELEKEPTKKKRKTAHKEESVKLKFIEEYQLYLLQRNYSISTIKPHLDRSKQFIRYINEISKIDVRSLDDLRALGITEINMYENYLLKRVNYKEIKPETAYSCIKNLKLFIDFLVSKKVIEIPYKIPKKFVAAPTRLNTYIQSDLLLELIQYALIDQTPMKYRNLAILLLLIDTGCRPVEISNLMLYDIKLSEKLITLHSVKSGKYTLILSDLVVKILKEYIKIRKKINTTEKHLFAKENGDSITPSIVSSTIYRLNLRAFGFSRVNARAIRHTHITNAIDNKNDFKEVSAAVGHKHWDSTMYYLHRSEKRLVANTLDFNPIQKLLEE